MWLQYKKKESEDQQCWKWWLSTSHAINPVMSQISRVPSSSMETATFTRWPQGFWRLLEFISLVWMGLVARKLMCDWPLCHRMWSDPKNAQACCSIGGCWNEIGGQIGQFDGCSLLGPQCGYLLMITDGLHHQIRALVIHTNFYNLVTFQFTSDPEWWIIYLVKQELFKIFNSHFGKLFTIILRRPSSVESRLSDCTCRSGFLSRSHLICD